MSDAEAWLQRYTKAMEEQDLDLLLSCWHPDVEATHLLHPDRSWRGSDLYRRVMGQIFESGHGSHMRILSTAIAGNTVFIESVTQFADGSEAPCVGIFELEDGRVRRTRVYTDVPTRDGVKMEDFVGGMST